jgi:uncharacterized membrane-anchored protein YhcB (DUF1043 family)
VAKWMWWLFGLVIGGLVVWFFKDNIKETSKSGYDKAKKQLEKMKKEETK